MKYTIMDQLKNWRIRRLQSKIDDSALEIRLIKKELFLVGSPAPAYIVADLEDAQARLEKYTKKLVELQNG